jgi:hypothetical protein
MTAAILPTEAMDAFDGAYRGVREAGSLCRPSDAPCLLTKCGVSDDSADAARVLGLHQEIDSLCVGNFVGAVWLDEVRRQFLLTTPKTFQNGQRIDYIRMWLHCLNNPVVSEHLDECFYCWPDEEPIPINDSTQEISLLVVLSFLRYLDTLCTRHLRRNFIRITDNLRGKVKGRVLSEHQLRDNVLRGRDDRAVCTFGVISDNCPENQILRAALERCARFLCLVSARQDLDLAHCWVRKCRAALAGVEVKRVTDRWFRGIWYGGTFRYYREPHRYAKMVLAMLGPDPDADLPTSTQVRIPPFALCTSELFERFCEARLRRHPMVTEIRPGYGRRTGRNLGGALALRPDFLLVFDGRPWVGDAKYKLGWAANGIATDDIFQIVTYSRHIGLGKFPDAGPLVGVGGELVPWERATILFPQPERSWDSSDQAWLAPRRMLERDFEHPQLFRTAVPCPGL